MTQQPPQSLHTIDATQAIAHLRRADATLRAIIDAVGTFSLRPHSEGFATLVNAIVSQQISTKAAAAIMRRLEAAVGDLLPARILALAPDDLRAAGLSNQKARYVLDLAAQTHSGALDFARLEDCTDESVIDQLTQIKGIGRWTAEMYLIFGLGRVDVLPVADLGLRQAIKRAYLLDELPDGAAIRSIAEVWRPYRSIAVWHLWRSLNNTPRI